MPPKSLTRRGGARSVAVSTTHPANVAAAAAKKAAGGGKIHPANVAAATAKKTAGRGNAIAVSTRESPPRALKIAAIAQIQAEAYAHRHAPCWGLYSYGMSMDRPYLKLEFEAKRSLLRETISPLDFHS